MRWGWMMPALLVSCVSALQPHAESLSASRATAERELTVLENAYAVVYNAHPEPGYKECVKLAFTAPFALYEVFRGAWMAAEAVLASELLKERVGVDRDIARAAMSVEAAMEALEAFLRSSLGLIQHRPTDLISRCLN